MGQYAFAIGTGGFDGGLGDIADSWWIFDCDAAVYDGTWRMGERKDEWRSYLSLTQGKIHGILPSLTLVKVKNGYKPSNYADYSRFLLTKELPA